VTSVQSEVLTTEKDTQQQDSVLRNLRETFVHDGKVGISQQKAADLCDVSRQTWAAWEAKTRPINLEQLNDIVTALGLDEVKVIEVVRWGKRDSPDN